MQDRPPTQQSEKPRSEPEIIPPGQDDPWRDPWRRGNRAWYFSGSRGSGRIYLTRLGPLSTFFIVAGIAVAAALLLILVLGAFLIWIPILGLIVAAALLSGLIRGYFRR
jgi:hypothetical protein